MFSKYYHLPTHISMGYELLVMCEMIIKEPRLHVLREQPGVHVPIYQSLYVLLPQTVTQYAAPCR